MIRAQAQLPFDEASYREGLGVGELVGEAGYTTLERRWARPAFDVNGIWGGFQGEDSKTIIPGVIESKSNFIEHPELVEQRVARYANLAGRDNVIAGSDCGFGTWVGQAAVDPDVVWAKLAAMAEGARLASQQFWKA